MRGWTRESDTGSRSRESHLEVGTALKDPPVAFLRRSLHTIGWGASLIRRARRRPLGALGAGLVLGLLLVALLGPVLAPYHPAGIDSGSVLVAPGRQHLLGTDNLGRDVLSRVVHGARLSLYVGVASVALGSLVGAALGLVSGYRGGPTDAVIQRFVDALMALPALILALVIVSALGASLHAVVAAIAVAQVPWASRVVRATTLSVRESQHVEAARALGCSDLRILAVHIMPQCLAPFLVVATAALGVAIIAEASLSFLGLGVPPPAPSWGGMLSDAARGYVRTAPWLAIAPGVAISLAVYGFNLLGDALRDALDPRLRGF